MYPRVINWEKIRNVCDKLKADFLADISHIAGFISKELYPSPFPFADIVTFSTY